MIENCGVEYRPANLRGLDFQILDVSITRGRRVVTNLYPFTDNHYNEDLGINPVRWSVKGAFTGENFRDDLQVANRLWTVKGDAVFFEPNENKSHPVKVIDFVADPDATSVNYIEFTLELIEKGDNPYPGLVGGLFGRVNSIIDNYISTVSTWYADAMEEINDVLSALQGFEAAVDFTLGIASLNAPASGFVETFSTISSTGFFNNSGTNISSIENIFETAASNDFPTLFFRQESEIRIAGNQIQSDQANMVALVALGYYFEDLADNGASYADLADFVERAEALKFVVNDQRISCSISDLILSLGSIANYKRTKTLTGQHHALVASYKLYGQINRASEILEMSGGVSGACLIDAEYCDDANNFIG